MAEHSRPDDHFTRPEPIKTPAEIIEEMEKLGCLIRGSYQRKLETSFAIKHLFDSHQRDVERFLAYILSRDA